MMNIKFFVSWHGANDLKKAYLSFFLFDEKKNLHFELGDYIQRFGYYFQYPDKFDDFNFSEWKKKGQESRGTELYTLKLTENNELELYRDDPRELCEKLSIDEFNRIKESYTKEYGIFERNKVEYIKKLGKQHILVFSNYDMTSWVGLNEKYMEDIYKSNGKAIVVRDEQAKLELEKLLEN